MPPKQTITADAHKVYEQALRFYATLDQLHRTSDVQRITVIGVPMSVLAAFASELFFKCLACLETGSLSREHLLDNLFDELSPNTQSIIEKHWDAIALQNLDVLDRLDVSLGEKLPRDLRANLTSGRDGFRLLRYVYEGGSDFRFTLGLLPVALHNSIIELKPEWVAQAQPVVDEPHAVSPKTEDNAQGLRFATPAVIDSKTTTHQWAVRWISSSKN